MKISVPLFFEIAAKRQTVVTGLQVAIIVGCILNLINQGNLLVTQDWGQFQWHKALLTFCVPFCVSVYSATVARLRFDPGTRAYIAAQLECRRCGKTRQVVAENAIVPDCPMCAEHTQWEAVDRS